MRVAKILAMLLLFPMLICAEELNDSVPMSASDSTTTNIASDTIIYLDENTLIDNEVETDTTSASVNGKEKKQVFYGVSAHVDVASTLLNLAIDKSVLTFEAAVDVDLLHCLFPIFEVGFTHVNKISGDVNYRVAAPFYRFGLNYNFLGRRRKPDEEKKTFIGCYPYVGLRYGFSLMSYHLEGVTINSDYWGSVYPSRAMQAQQKYVYGGWAEVVGGVRVNMAKGFTMGWTLRVGLLSHASKGYRTQIWYLPGFGKNNSVNFGFNYTFGYSFNYDKNDLKKKNKK